ncbi:MAG: hypothetical protein HOI80_02385 [Alphaproteobacteria bacterium]|jgi:hypothetical protein|nr:hypothetical protein [Alphaproteobacteria bacterium]MBT5390075.1 hypothetical protein [Alphaproteobacteria bacterium]MBT5540093.1 hypothetical protein [Alphaproteobacteria bacterium]MBT5654332.1 hypothetical protein [Alphaproteobacteria bacterium]
MKQNAKWDQKEIYRLNQQYIKGYPLKIIAETMELTVTGINKSLDRFNIRNPENIQLRKDARRDYIVHRKALVQLRSIPVPVSKYARLLAAFNWGKFATRVDAKRKHQETMTEELDTFVTFKTVISWLQKQGFIVKEIPSQRETGSAESKKYRITLFLAFHKRPVRVGTPPQVLMFANNYRNYLGMRPFYVENITEH